MKKIFNLILASSVALGFAACNNDRAQNGPENDGASTMLRLTVSEAQTRADGQEDVAGEGAESLANDGLFLTLGYNKTFVSPTFVKFPTNPSSNESTYTSEVFKYTGATGKQTATFVLNFPQSGNMQITDANQTISIDNLSELVASTGFTMTGTTNADENKINIKKGKTVEDVEGGANTFPFEIERVVSKVQFSKTNSMTYGDGLKESLFSDFRYAVAGSANKVYLFADNAARRTMGTDKTYNESVDKKFKSAIDGTTRAQGETPRAGVVKVSDKNLVAHFDDSTQDATNWVSSNSLTLSELTGNDTKSQKTGIFFLENSLGGDAITGKGQLKYNDITYVKVYAKFAPEQVISINENGVRKADDTVITAETAYFVPVTKAYKIAHPASASYVYGGTEDAPTLKIVDKAGTFYVGANGLFYKDLKSARLDNNPTSRKFSSGKMVWMTPANNQVEGEGDAAYTKYADTRRNNIYALDLTAINKIGENYDPIDPEDPNLDNPEDNPNPDEPEKDKEVPVDPTVNNIRVKATILKWNLVHRGVVLN